MKSTKIPKGATKIALRPLALGEKTGHHHSLVALDEERNINDLAEMYEMDGDGGKRVFLRVSQEGVALVHQEHKTQAVPAGEYEVSIQTEITDWGAAPVQD